jgi:two-component system phosphate regulon sensor histidine kinase PhoR
MRKRTLVLLAIVLAATFVGLLVEQFIYLNEMVSMRREQFDESVKRSLLRISKQLERDETRHYLEEYFGDEQLDQIESLSVDTLEDDDDDDDPAGALFHSQATFSFRGPNGEVSTFEFHETLPADADSTQVQAHFSLSPKHGNNTIPNRSKAMQDMLRGQYRYQKDLLDEVVFRMLYQSSRQPVLSRLDILRLETLLSRELLNGGLNLSYEYCIIDSDGRMAYRTPGFSHEQAAKATSYLQVLFPNTLTTRPGYMEIYFPNRGRHILNSGLRFMVPSFVFSFIMLILFLLILFIAVRQKKLAEMKNDFINNMTHEFKTPISTISLASQMLNDPSVSKSPSLLQHISGVINDETKRLRFQVEKVLQMSMFDRQKANLKLQDMSVNALVQTVVNTFRLKVEKAGGSIDAHLDAEDDICMIDEMHFTNVVFNLMDNAYKYAREGVPLHLVVTTRTVGQHLELSIADNGIGIKRENLKKIFEKFYRVPTGNVHNVKGFGLGLAYVMKIVRDHKGEIKAESEFGEGTTFIISIPLYTE